jgi:curli production assembly/transport component CsgG
MRIVGLFLSCLLLSSCATTAALNEKVNKSNAWEQPKVVSPDFFKRPENILKPPKAGKITVSVYKFSDQTGQRKPNDKLAVFSSAVTQAPDAYLVKALQDVGDGQWFRVIERGDIDNLIKERQLIKSMRDLYEGPTAKQLDPLLFSGLMIEGGVVGYDSNITSGGSGVRIAGVGPQTQFRTDVVTVNLRVVSVNTGEILASVTTTKSIASYSDDLNVLKFVDLGTNTIEGELGIAINESVNLATQRAIEAAVVEMIREGARKGFWSFK